ncbi:MAG: NAD(P)/FAD-dependent oxidoreductase [Rhizobiaceae bacterium]
MTRHVAILGAGVIGCMSAIELLRQGETVTIIEPEEPGGKQAASYGNAAWLSSHSVIPPAGPGVWRKVPEYLLDPLGPLAIRPAYLPRVAPWLWRYLRSASTPAKVASIGRALRPLLRDAPSLHAAIASEAGCSELIDATSGLMHIYPSRKEFAAEALGWDVRREVGIEWEELEGPKFRALQPNLHSRYQFGVLVPEAGHCRDPGAYVAALAACARQWGAKVVKAAAKGFRIEGGRLKAVLTDSDEVVCDAAVVTAGARSKPLAAAAGDHVPLETERGYHAVLENVSVGPTVPVMVSDCKMVVTVVGGNLRAAGQVEFAGLEAPPNMKRAEILKNNLLGMFPALKSDPSREKVQMWMGHRPSMPDGMPCIGKASATRDIIYAFGHGHIGLVSSARTGRIVAQLVSGRKPEIPVGPFDPRRF